MKLLVAVLIAGCASRANPPSTIPHTQLGTQHSAEIRHIEPTATAPAPPEAERLLVATNALSLAPARAEHGRIVGALERLADALAVVAPQRTELIQHVRESAARIEESGPESSEHAELVRGALVAAGRALRSIPFDETTVEGLRLRDAADDVVREAEAIDPGAPLMQQYRPVRAALRASTEAVYSAMRAPAPPLVPLPDRG